MTTDNVPHGSNVISLSAALDSIERDNKRSPSAGSPFFFMVGAGVSSPVIPMAGQIIEHCRKQIAASREPPSNPASTYSWHIEQAYPSVEKRWEYFRQLIDGKPLSRTNRLLALALSKRVFGSLSSPQISMTKSRRPCTFWGRNIPP